MLMRDFLFCHLLCHLFSALQSGLPSPLPVQTACHPLYYHKLACQTTFLCDHVPLFSAFLCYKKFLFLQKEVYGQRSLATEMDSFQKENSMQNLRSYFPKTFRARLSLPPRFWGREAAVSALPRVLSPHGESLKSWVCCFSVGLVTAHEPTDILIIICRSQPGSQSPISHSNHTWWGFLLTWMFKLSLYLSVRLRSQRLGWQSASSQRLSSN